MLVSSGCLKRTLVQARTRFKVHSVYLLQLAEHLRCCGTLRYSGSLVLVFFHLIPVVTLSSSRPEELRTIRYTYIVRSTMASSFFLTLVALFALYPSLQKRKGNVTEIRTTIIGRDMHIVLIHLHRYSMHYTADGRLQTAVYKSTNYDCSNAARCNPIQGIPGYARQAFRT
ncbi:uncharacterized protein EI97DRAFT_34518 [Westerdykella ornata]|uniref:Uncharacterized protein n=1 Tax=Westerdykella ornata TaxID=318751 RepID=A0A6A6K2I5_WESOR|nr:uncharacterized protein EI97DRAFT_34518 [Westerdykella ornata]KAF2281609.1 hypothetical protein EI97DRAFT_34518 [Westerdykella ornata]